MAGNAVVDEREIVKVESIINSMTPQERVNPDVINESRKKRIAKGSGRTLKNINDVLKKFKMMRNVMKNMGSSGLMSKVAGGLSNLPGMGGMGDLGSIMGGGSPMGDLKPRKIVSVSAKKKLKQKRKQSRKSRKKGRKK